MAKKSRTSKSKSNDSQKKLLALVLIILFVGLGVFLVVSSFAAKGGGKGKPGSGVTLVDSPYAITYRGAPNAIKYPNSVTIQAVDKVTGALLNPMPESLSTSGACYATTGSYAGGFNKALLNGEITLALDNIGYANGANCTAYLNIARNDTVVPTAMVNFTIIP